MFRKAIIRTLPEVLAFVSVAAATALTLGLATAVARGADPVYFPRDLAEGDVGLDVYNLQIALNVNPATQVASSGEGSPGMESGYFGAMTKAAVVRYQEGQEIEPADGRVAGETKRSLAAVLLAKYADESAATSTEDVGSAGAASGDFLVFSGQKLSFERGARETIFGHGFEAGSRYDLVVASTSKVFARGVASTTMTVEFKVPSSRAGRQTIYLADVDGRRSNSFDLYVVDRGSAPSIATVTPAIIRYGDEVVIRGTGFSREGNAVVTSLGEVANLPAKKRGGQSEIKFTSTIGDRIPRYIRDVSTSTVPVTLYVMTARGPSNQVVVNVEL